MVWKAALVFAAFVAQPVAANAKPDTFRAEVEKAKASLIETSDKTFAAQMQSGDDPLRNSGLTAFSARNVTLWLTLGVSIGMCDQFGGNQSYAVWMSATDGFGPQSENARKHGNRMVQDGKAMSAEFNAAFCKTEMAAVRELLAERFYVR